MRSPSSLGTVRRCRTRSTFLAALGALATFAAGAVAAEPAAKPATTSTTKPVAPPAASKRVRAVVLELDGGDKLALTGVAGPEVSIPFTVENRTTAPLKAVSIAVTPFTAPTGELAVATIAPAAVDVPAGETRQFQVAATFPAAATYTARARVREGTRELAAFRIELARIRGKPPVDVGDVAALQQTASLGHRPFTLPVTLKLYATGGAVALPRPILHSAILKPKADSAAGQAVAAQLDASHLPEPIRVEPGQVKDLTLNLTGFGSPGRYDVKLRFVPAGFDVIEKDIIVYVRDPVWMALTTIFLGVVLSLLVHAYGRVIRPRMLGQQRVAALLARLRELRNVPDPDARRLVANVGEEIRRQWDGARAARQQLAPHVATYEQIVAALGAWSELRQGVKTLRPASVQRELLDKLDEVAGAFREVPPDVAKVTTAVTTLREFALTMAKAVGKELRRQLEALGKELRTDPRPAAARLRTALDLVTEKLDRGQLEVAVGSFDQVRLQYTVLLADDLRARVAAAAPPPGMTEADWRALGQEVRKAVSAAELTSNADDAMAAIRHAMKSYVHQVVAALRTAAAALGDETRAKPVLDALAPVETSLEANDFTGAWRNLETAQASYQKAVVPVGRPMGADEKVALAALASAAGGGVVGKGAFDIMEVIDAPPASADLDRPGAEFRVATRLTVFDFVTSLIVLASAVLIGLQVLWVDSPTWGGVGSYLIAFGWGFALDQFTHAGVAALRPK